MFVISQNIYRVLEILGTQRSSTLDLLVLISVLLFIPLKTRTADMKLTVFWDMTPCSLGDVFLVLDLIPLSLQ